MKIFLFDSWKLKFMQPVLEHWQALGHEVEWDIWWGSERVERSELCYFYPVDNNLKRASNEQEKPPGVRVVAEAVDVDIYGGHWRSVNWGWVDALVCMSKHMIDYMRPHLPDSLPVYHVPGGVDLDKWTMRVNPERNYNVAWVGHYWIAKNVFGAIQIFRQLVQRDKQNPWHLYIRGQKWSPNWWRRHVEAYVEDNAEFLRDRITWSHQWLPDLNGWLEDKAYILSTSFKEALGYAIAEAAAKGIKPVVQNTVGARDIWPSSWLFDTHLQAELMLSASCPGCYRPKRYRTFIESNYPLSRRLEILDEICFG